jgi:hypothetical protein
MYQPYPSSGQSAGPLRPPAPAPVLTAVKLMYAGAPVSAVELIIGLALIIVDIRGAARGQFRRAPDTVPSQAGWPVLGQPATGRGVMAGQASPRWGAAGCPAP